MNLIINNLKNYFMRLFSSRIKNVVPLSLLAVLVCTSCSQDSELDQSLEELENGDYQTLADMNMTRSGESDIAVIKAGSFTYGFVGPFNESVTITFSWTRGYPNRYEPLSVVTASVEGYIGSPFVITKYECTWEGGNYSIFGRFYYRETDYWGNPIGQEKFFDVRTPSIKVFKFRKYSNNVIKKG